MIDTAIVAPTNCSRRPLSTELVSDVVLRTYPLSDEDINAFLESVPWPETPVSKELKERARHVVRAVSFGLYGMHNMAYSSHGKTCEIKDLVVIHKPSSAYDSRNSLAFKFSLCHGGDDSSFQIGDFLYFE